MVSIQKISCETTQQKLSNLTGQRFIYCFCFFTEHKWKKI